MADYSDLFDTREERTDTVRDILQHRRENGLWTTAELEAQHYTPPLTPLGEIVERRTIRERLYRRYDRRGLVQELWVREA